jgi:beta-galactosidase
MIQIGSQYYRPPFPVQKHWADDMKKMKDSGLDSVQLWLVWAWIESKQGTFDFKDYDTIIELADKNKLSVVLSTSAELQPYWIHRVVPNSEMVNNLGHKIISSNRCENHFGLTPGGCFDHPDVWALMKNFLENTTLHYRNCPTLSGWDAWNELRYNVHSDSLVCFCSHTINKWHLWLQNKFGSLDNLNRIWLRRYNSFDEILPGKVHNRTYTEMMSWQHFRTWNCDNHGKNRYDAIKKLDTHHVVTVHAATPSPLMNGGLTEHAIDKGNDWELAKNLDGIGCSSFPKWFGLDDASFGMRIEFVHSAANGKKIWLSEIQGGRAGIGFSSYKEVDASSQQRWIWNGLACGADKILFWCWRDEVFGRESGGFGIIGRDGLADERVAGLQATRRVLEKNKECLEDYKPNKDIQAGILFSPQSYYLTWSQEGNATRSTKAMEGYARALVRSSIPYKVVEENNLEALNGLKVLFLPRVLATSETLNQSLIEFVKNGGTLVCESETAAFTPEGFYRYPEERMFFEMLKIEEVGRRPLPPQLISVELDTHTVELPSFQWVTPMVGGKPSKSLCKVNDGHLAAEYAYGKGKIIHLGSYFGEAYLDNWNSGFEELIAYSCKQSGVIDFVEVMTPLPSKTDFLYVKHGLSRGKRMIFLFFPENSPTSLLRLSSTPACSGKFRELFSNQIITAKKMNQDWHLIVHASAYNLSILEEIE